LLNLSGFKKIPILQAILRFPHMPHRFTGSTKEKVIQFSRTFPEDIKAAPGFFGAIFHLNDNWKYKLMMLEIEFAF